MKTKLLLLIILTSCFFSSCTKELLEQEKCTVSNLEINSSDNIYYDFDNRFLAYWNGRYSEELVEIHVDYDYDGHHPSRRDVGFVFKKVNNCLEFDYAYRTDLSWQHNKTTTSINVNEVIIQNWEEDRLFSGKIVEINNNGDRVIRDFWVEFDINDQYDFSYDLKTTSNCIDITTPKEIDLNNDGITDISFEKVDLNFHYISIVLNTNSIKLVTQNNNSFLEGDYDLFTEPPFSSNNRNEYINGNNNWDDILGMLIEFEPPYDRLNLWYSSPSAGFRYTTQTQFLYPHSPELNPMFNDIDDYLIVKVEKDGLFYYGWIRMKIDFNNCLFDIVETYLNPTPNEHVTVP